MGSFHFFEEVRKNLWVDIETGTRETFVQDARIVCEAIFYIALLGYQNSLNAYHKYYSLDKGDSKKASMWSSSLDHAKEALRNAMDAVAKRTAGEEDKANELAFSALSELGER
jgi:hypothetical protein